MGLAKRNVAVLASCQALLFANNATLIAIASLVGWELAPDKSLATLPLTASVFGTALLALPASLLMKRIGRRAGFMLGSLLGLLGVGLSAIAVSSASFWLLCVAMSLFGAYGAFAQYYRFAAAEAAPAEFKSTAISLVLAGGLVGGLIGPEVSKLTVDLFSARFLGTYLSLAVYIALVMLLLIALRSPPLTESEQREQARPLSVIARQPAFFVAVIGAALGFGVMNFLMVATPLAMEFHGHHYDAAAFVIQWHIIAMFAPSFFTGWLIKRLGVLNVMLAGAAALTVCIVIALVDVTVMHFWFSLVFLGVGWNFLYVGGTTLLTETYRPAERAKTEGVNDFVVFFTQALTSVASGWMLERSGWVGVNYLAVPLVVVVGGVVGWLMFKRRVVVVG